MTTRFLCIVGIITNILSAAILIGGVLLELLNAKSYILFLAGIVLIFFTLYCSILGIRWMLGIFMEHKPRMMVREDGGLWKEIKEQKKTKV